MLEVRWFGVFLLLALAVNVVLVWWLNIDAEVLGASAIAALVVHEWRYHA